MPDTSIPHIFGGKWTQKKLDVIRKYFKAYFKVMNKQKFKLIYIDAFAGTGSRFSSIIEDHQTELFKDEQRDADSGEDAKTGFFDGSAMIAIKLENPFHNYYFIEKDKTRMKELEKNIKNFGEEGLNISYECEDANQVLEKIVKRQNWKETRGIIFLDPYGVSVDFDTISTIAEISNLDIWCLFPIGTIRRLLARNYDKVIQKNKDKLNKFFGTKNWINEFYNDDNQMKLFNSNNTSHREADKEYITNYYINRLRTVFSYVLDDVLFLENSKKSKLYALIFAMSCKNKRAHDIGGRIASHLIKDASKV